MYTYLLAAHNILRWVILRLLLANIFRHLAVRNQNFTDTDKKLSLFLLISAHLTLLVGLYQWFAGPLGYQLLENASMSEVMKNSASRFWVVEHPLGMIIAIMLITIAHSNSKKDLPHATKHKRMLLLQFFALVVIVATIPWPFRDLVARPLFPGY